MNVPATLIGTRLGQYEIQSLIGSGGMAQVFRAFDHNLQRLVAVKVLTEAAAAHPGLAARFEQEARFIARLRHPAIVHVYDYGQANGLAYIVQELLPGPTLEQELAAEVAHGQRLPREDVLAIISQLAAALDAAHAAGIIHRDVKPSNAMRNRNGKLVLTDFGIARATQPEARHTQAGLVIGTPDYISPEQAEGREPTPASDIYALGVLAYEMLASRRPFEADTPMGVLFGHLHKPPPPLATVRPDLPPRVSQAVERALAKAPAQRPASAGEFAQELAQSWRSGPSPVLQSAPTTAWVPASPVSPGLASLPTHVNPLPQPARTTAPPLASRPAASLSRSGRSPLPLLAGLLLLLLGGGFIATRGSDQQPTGQASAQGALLLPSAAPSQTPAQVTAAPASTAPVEPTAAPVEATAAPVEPTAAPPVGPIETLRAILQGTPQRDRYARRLAEVERALAKSDTEKAATQLRDLREKLADDEDALPSDVRQAALAQVEQIATAYGLSLEGGEDGNDNDKDNDD